MDVVLTAPRAQEAAGRLLPKVMRRNGVPETLTRDGRDAKEAARTRSHAEHGTPIAIRPTGAIFAHGRGARSAGSAAGDTAQGRRQIRRCRSAPPQWQRAHADAQADPADGRGRRRRSHWGCPV